MSHSLFEVYVHIVFSTKNRIPFLDDNVLRGRTHAYLGGLCKRLDSPVLAVGGVEDHVHIACRQSRHHAPKDFMRLLKEKSSKWMKTTDPSLDSFYWQIGYGMFSVSPGHLPALRLYIANQEEHHRTETFQEEYRRLLKKYGVEYDERYIWD